MSYWILLMYGSRRIGPAWVVSCEVRYEPLVRAESVVVLLDVRRRCHDGCRSGIGRVPRVGGRG